MKKINMKKLLILNVPYFLIGAIATNLGEAWRIAAGTNMSEKLQGMVTGGAFGAAFSNPMPSIHPIDLLVGLAVGGALRQHRYPLCKQAYCVSLMLAVVVCQHTGVHVVQNEFLKILVYSRTFGNVRLDLFKLFWVAVTHRNYIGSRQLETRRQHGSPPAAEHTYFRSSFLAHIR